MQHSFGELSIIYKKLFGHTLRLNWLVMYDIHLIGMIEYQKGSCNG